jgi:hypothetical protein
MFFTYDAQDIVDLKQALLNEGKSLIDASKFVGDRYSLS